MSSECWVYGGYKAPSGYGQIWVSDEKRPLMAHRLVYEALVGDIPEGLQLDHLCRNRSCVNPEHLEPVTMKINILRGEGLAAQNARKTACKLGHEFITENTYIRKDRPVNRDCRTCRYMAVKRYLTKKERISI
jgi:hypothetical protein